MNSEALIQDSELLIILSLVLELALCFNGMCYYLHLMFTFQVTIKSGTQKIKTQCKIDASLNQKWKDQVNNPFTFKLYSTATFPTDFPTAAKVHL